MTYLDSNVIIRLIEGVPAVIDSLRSTLLPLGPFVTSDLSRLEARCGPVRAADRRLLSLFDDFFAQPDLTLVGISRSVIDLATDYRARLNLKTADAIHAASAELAGCKKFVTGDRALRRVGSFQVVIA